MFKIREFNITRGHDFTLSKDQNILDVRQCSFSQRSVTVWNKLSTDIVHSSSQDAQEQNNQIYCKGRLHI